MLNDFEVKTKALEIASQIALQCNKEILVEVIKNLEKKLEIA